MRGLQQELSQFLKKTLTKTAKERETNKEAAKFLYKLAFVKFFKVDQVALCSMDLVFSIYDFGFYPREVLSFLSTNNKIRLSFEDLKEATQTERFIEIILETIQNSPSIAASADFFRLLCSMRLHAIANSALLKSVIVCVGNHLGVYAHLDKYLYIILSKLVLKLADLVKEFRCSIADQAMGVVCNIFRKFSSHEIIEQGPFLCVYLNLLRLLVLLGKDVVMWQSQGNTSSHTAVFLKLLIFNLQLSYTSFANKQNFSNDHPLFSQIAECPDLVMWCQKVPVVEDSDYLTGEPSQWQEQEKLTKDTMFLEPSSYEELVDLIKVKSLTLSLQFIRHLPECFTQEDIQNFILPDDLLAFDAEEIFQSKDFYPQAFFNELSEDPDNSSGFRRPLLEDINRSLVEKFKESPTRNMQALKDKIIQNFADPERGASLIHTFVREERAEVKTLIADVLWTLFSTEFRRLTFKTQPNLDQDFHVRLWANLQNHALQSIALFFIELYSTSELNLPNFLGCFRNFPKEMPVSPISKSLGLSLAKFFIFPVLRCWEDLSDAFVSEFERFIDAVFDAGFSEYFLSSLVSFKEILMTNLRKLKMKKEGFWTLPKIRVLSKFCLKMIVIEPCTFIDVAGYLETICLNTILNDSSCSIINSHIPNLGTQIEVMRTKMFSSQPLKVRFFENLPPISQNVFFNDEPIFLSKDDLFKADHSLSVFQMKLGVLESKIFERMMEHCWNSSMSDGVDIPLVAFLTSLPASTTALLSREIYCRKGFFVESALVKLLKKLIIKKVRLEFVRYVLRNPILSMPNLTALCWDELFKFYNDSVLSVETVCANYNIIYGLKNYQHFVADEIMLTLMSHSLKSLRTKNRKLINNCLKIYCIFLAYCQYSVIETFLDMEVPNVFYDEMEEEGCIQIDKTLTGAEFLGICFVRFLMNKYLRYTSIQFRHLIMVINSRKESHDSTARKIIKIVAKAVPSALLRMESLESYRYSALCMQLVSKQPILDSLSVTDLSVVSSFIKKTLPKVVPEEWITPDEKDAFKIIRDHLVEFLFQIEDKVYKLPPSYIKIRMYNELVQDPDTLVARLKPFAEEKERKGALLAKGALIDSSASLSLDGELPGSPYSKSVRLLHHFKDVAAFASTKQCGLTFSEKLEDLLSTLLHQGY